MNDEKVDIGYREVSPRRYMAADQYNIKELLAMGRSRALSYLLMMMKNAVKSPDPATAASADTILLDTIRVMSNGRQWGWYADEIVKAYEERT